MGLLFQFGALFTDLSVFDNIAFPIRENTNLDEESINDLVQIKLNAVGLNGIEKMMPEQLSGGMARRVALARSIALDPFLLMYDEPFTGLDPLSVRIIAKLIKQLNDSLGLTSILVSHDIKTSLEISDNIIVLSNGKIVCDTSPKEIASNYNENFLDLFGSFPNSNNNKFMKSIGLL
jgi:phospholipid/cholesterol/gamma-HCH transport system ATP-binding protein